MFVLSAAGRGAGAFVLCLLVTVAHAQPKKAPAPATSKTFTVSFSDGMIGGQPVPLSLNLRETRQGTAVKQTELEGCFASSYASHKLDRFSGMLTQKDGVWRLSAVTTVNKAPVDITLKRSGKPDAPNFVGEIKLPNGTLNFEQQDAAFSEDAAPDPADAVDDFSATPGPDVSPDTVSISVKPASILAVIPLLRKYRVKMKEEHFFAECEALREDSHDITAVVDPQQAAALVNEAKAVPGVIRAGWTRGTATYSEAVRFEGPPYLANGQVDREKILGVVSDAISKVLALPVRKKPEVSAQGITTLFFGGPSSALPNSGLNEVAEVNVYVAPESGAGKTGVLLYIEEIDQNIEDTERALTITEKVDDNGKDEGSGLARFMIQTSVARALGGQLWNGDTKAWVKP